MKKLFLCAVLAVSSMCGRAQMPQLPQLPIDPQVKVGQLDNGLTYYIRHNEEPKGQADFFIAQKVGSMQEEDNQRGLAHFLEHMCFNGTTHFPGKNIIEYLAANGVKFGYNLNAYTSLDETVYNISQVPLTRPTLVDSCLLILHDWSHDLLLEGNEIDAERGVIHEEWRGSGASRRMITSLLPDMYPGLRYGQRMPIGTMEVVDNFPHQLIRDYYHKWYRPDLQAVIVVGDINPGEIEQKIKTIFADIPAPENPAERTYEAVPDNAEPIVAFASDKEQRVNNAMVMFKSDKLPAELRNTQMYFITKYMSQMMCTMLNARFGEMLQTAQPPFLMASSDEGDYFVASTKDAFSLDFAYADGGMETALKAVMREWKRARDFGFTPGEYARTKAEYVRQYETAYNDRAKRTSTTLAQECARNFTTGEPMPGIEMEYQLAQALAANLPVEAINELMPQMQVDTNLVVAFMNTATEQAYTRQQVLDIINDVMGETLEAYVDKVSGEPIMKEVPQGGSIVKEEAGAYGSRRLTLGNGVKVVIKPTDFKQDEVLLAATRPGGTSVYDNKDLLQVMWAGGVHNVMGLGNFSATDLEKALAGIMAGASVNIGQSAETVSGSCSPRDLRTMLQLIYLQFQPQRIDNDAFESYKNRTRDALKNQDAVPGAAFRDSLSTTLMNRHPRATSAKAWMMDCLNLDSLALIYNQRFGHADGFTFYLVGKLDGDSIDNLVATYLGALPVSGVKDKWVDRKMLTAKGKVDNYFSRPLEQEKATTAIIVTGKAAYSLENIVLIECIEQALDDATLTRMREEIGGTYSPSVQCGVSRSQGRDQAQLLIYFDCAADQRDLLVQIANDCIDKLAKEGPSEETVKKTREYLLKNYASNQTKNGYWLNSLDMLDWNKVDLVTDYEKAVNAITAAKVKKLAQQIVKQGNRTTISMTPEK